MAVTCFVGLIDLIQMASSHKNHIETGKRGEDIAVEFLVRQAYTIVTRNFRFGNKEIDIVCSKDNLLIFVEVKSRTNQKYGLPEESVTPKKQSLILKAAQHFIELHQYQGNIRFDIIAIKMNANKKPEIHHIEDAFFGFDL